MTRKLATVLFSGGIDSTSCVRFFMDRDYEVRGQFFDFGQAAAICEKRAVDRLRDQLKISVTTIRIPSNTEFGTGELVGRNAFLVFAAIFLGGCRDGVLAIGVHAGTPYYDCSPAFISRIGPLVEECTDGRVSVVAPFVSWEKDDVYSYFSSLKIPVSQTYSCEAGTTPPCTKCASCKDRMRFKCTQSDAR